MKEKENGEKEEKEEEKASLHTWGAEVGRRRKNKQMSPLAGTQASGTAFRTYFCMTLMEIYWEGCGICH